MTRQAIIDHILRMREFDEDYAREATLWYHDLLPWIGLLAGVGHRLTMEAKK